MFRFVVVVFLSEKTFAVSSSSSLRYRIPRPDLRTRLSFTRNQTRKFFRTTPVSQPTTMTTTTMTTTTKIQNTMIHHPHSRRRRRRQHSSCWLQSLLLSTTFLFLLLLTRCYGQPSPVPYLTVENYDELTRSKTVFIKFFAPWYVYCYLSNATFFFHGYLRVCVCVVVVVDCCCSSIREKDKQQA